MRVLIVDDQQDLREALKTEFEMAGIQAVCARHGENALEIMKLELFDVVLTDVLMPGADGLQAVREIKRQFPKMRVMLMTGNPAIATAILSREGVEHVFSKPIDLENLIARVRFPTE